MASGIRFGLISFPKIIASLSPIIGYWIRFGTQQLFKLKAYTQMC